MGSAKASGSTSSSGCILVPCSWPPYFRSDPVVSAKYFATLVLYVGFGYGVPRWRPCSGRVAAGLGSPAVGTILLTGYVLARHLLMGVSLPTSYDA
ncbi:MAG: hypothetical protein WKG07_16555 [Hymenobacter sp.]